MASFIRKDLDIIEEEWNVRLFEVRQNKPLLLVKDLFAQLFFLFVHVWSAKRLVCMFGGYHSILPGVFGFLFRKPVWIMPGGYDCYAFPDIGYGAFHKKWFGRVVGWSYRLADVLSPVHASMVNQPYTYYNSGFPNQGFGFFVKGLDTKVLPINNGYEPEVFQDLKLPRKRNSFLTVARDTSGATYFRKGIDLILEVARYFPDFEFTIIGKNESQEIVAPPNVCFIPPVPYSELPFIYNQYEFYLQLSIAEGFPNALSEAMLSGCIPIGSDVFGIPDLIGETGLILKKRDIQLLKDLLEQTRTMDKVAFGPKARSRVASLFTLEMRRQKMLSLLRSLSK